MRSAAVAIDTVVTRYSRGVSVDIVMQMDEEKMEVAADAVVLTAGKSVAGGKNAGKVL